MNIINDFESINVKNRKYYDFYREVKRVINKLRDLHFYLIAKNCTENGIQIKQIEMCMLFHLMLKEIHQKMLKCSLKK